MIVVLFKDERAGQHSIRINDPFADTMGSLPCGAYRSTGSAKDAQVSQEEGFVHTRLSGRSIGIGIVEPGTEFL
jgi:hypothetical protein